MAIYAPWRTKSTVSLSKGFKILMASEDPVQLHAIPIAIAAPI